MAMTILEVMKLMDQFQPILVYSPTIATQALLLAKSSLECIGSDITFGVNTVRNGFGEINFVKRDPMNLMVSP
jgi:hypothetical protein